MFPIIPANSVTADKGNQEGIFGFGAPSGTVTAITNLVSNTGVVASDTAAVAGAFARQLLAGTEYGGDKGIFGYGTTATFQSMSNLVSNTGVVASDTAGVGTARNACPATQFGGDQGIFGFGSGPVGMSNLVTNAGVIGLDVAAVGTARDAPGACSFN